MDAIDAFLRGTPRQPADEIDAFLRGGTNAPPLSPGQGDQNLANEQAATPSGVWGAPIRTATPPPPRGAVVSPYARERESLRARGVDPTGTDIGAQFNAGFGRTDEEAFRLQGYEPRQDPQTGRTIVRAPGQDNWTTVDMPGAPGANLVGQAIPPVLSAIGGTAGAVLGARSGPKTALALGTAGAGVGQGAGEAARLGIGKRMGVVPQDANILDPALSEGTLAAITSGIFGLGYNAVKALARRGLFPGLKDITIEQYEAWSKAAREKVAGTSVEGKLRPSQVMAASDDPQAQNLADRAMAHEKRILTQPGKATDKLRENMRAQRESVEQDAAALRGEAPTLSPEQIGLDVERAAQREVRSDLRSAVQGKGSAGAARAEATASQQVLEPSVQPDYVGEPIRQRITRAYDTAEEVAGQGYARVRAMPGAESGQALNTVAELRRSQDTINRILIPSLNEQDRQLVEPTLQRLVREVVVDDDGLPIRAARPGVDTNFTANRFSGVTLDELDATLRAIRREVRKVNTGVATTDVQQLMRLENALQADRDIILGPERARALGQAEVGWRKLRDEFNRAPLIDRVLSRKSGGAEKVEDFQLGRLSLNPDNARAIANVLRGDPEALEMMRRAIRYKAQEAAGLRSGEPLNPAGLQGWLDKNDALLSSVFSRDEIKSMFNPARMQREYLAVQKVMDDVRKTIEPRYARYGIERDFAGRIKDPASYVDNVLGSGNAALARETMGLLRRRSPETAKEIAAMARQRLHNDIGGDQPSRQKIAALIQDEPKMRVYQEVMGDQFKQRLVQMDNLVKTLFPDTLPAPVEGTSSSLMRNLQRVLLSPLSALSRRVTLFRGLSEEEISNRIAMAMVDDTAFRQLARAAADSRWTRGIGMGAAGAAPDAERTRREYMNGR